MSHCHSVLVEQEKTGIENLAQTDNLAKFHWLVLLKIHCAFPYKIGSEAQVSAVCFDLFAFRLYNCRTTAAGSELSSKGVTKCLTFRIRRNTRLMFSLKRNPIT